MKKLIFSLLLMTLSISAQTTSTALKAQIDTQITNKTGAGSITKTAVGNNIKAVVDYVDQQDAAAVSVVKVRKTTISSAQVLNIFSTPVEIVPAVAGKIIVPTNIVIIINFNTTQYSDVGGAWRVRFGSTSTSIATVTSYLGSASYNQQVLQTLFYSAFTTSSSFDNSPILLTTTGNNPIGGNSGISVYVTYTEITL
jgi:hypothetical protein